MAALIVVRTANHRLLVRALVADRPATSVTAVAGGREHGVHRRDARSCCCRSPPCSSAWPSCRCRGCSSSPCQQRSPSPPSSTTAPSCRRSGGAPSRQDDGVGARQLAGLTLASVCIVAPDRSDRSSSPSPACSTPRSGTTRARAKCRERRRASCPWPRSGWPAAGRDRPRRQHGILRGGAISGVLRAVTVSDGVAVADQQASGTVDPSCSSPASAATTLGHDDGLGTWADERRFFLRRGDGDGALRPYAAKPTRTKASPDRSR